ncbi:hypothetical protein [Pseudomonas chlororaphis]|uniref:hypothetical protein n=1 Tax=Pseudomonas chlororaphis TaxID=587753 RepID=UPI001B30FBF3|nr:hypothetical protein [Pseudomonas chlororaphis]MBP5059224.1 hypothetical protein [Pseudomonas chlororaphis]MBP5137966.1 hypothetical protein [Pseudomonas chlororaphis]QTT98312.1 hypothetical protein HUT26_03120 [Pseudomonas chlororaphis]
MNVERRTVLKGLALSSLAGIAMGSSGLTMAHSVLAAQARPVLPTLALVSNEAAESIFLQGGNASPAGKQVKVQRTDLSLDFMLGFEKRLRSGQPQRIIGLVDDASAALIIDLARSAGARVQWLGQHRATANASQHRLLSAEAASGCAPQLGLSLNACGAGFSLTEHRMHGLQAPLQVSAAARNSVGADQWAATLGYTLAALGTSSDGQAPLVTRRPSPLTGNFVSFSIEA